MTDPIDQHLADSAARTETDHVLDRLTADNDRMLAALDEVIDVEAGLQQILDRAKEA
ncbi:MULTISPECIES: hypothetical protein [unclassified Streptomyces]|uniref:hypothetical protein n=1 Tax=unclassified Streptomyces TaxID=2593676 RepID=UPI00088885BA|nr:MULTISPECIES: hypothetical protein [unclassified Streptomyces]PBC72301.1 hypothetical protein BX261_7385 [Streptomyces sp. 2321.6]SDR62246.1 hypothetical protein SAMN05216511_7318 [Streptomyces sp. KS_16]SEE51345.1 hypothetical protein SAMN05428940_7367 [Streptomyces sp. 2133.1]SNC77805.1 hypothetical protein SAMN06272741_7221 [Streptomyces sp. 2114.4]